MIPLVRDITDHYDRIMYSPLQRERVGGSGYSNFGYWTNDTVSAEEAGDNLVEQLLALIPEKTGKILDVGCGRGATTLYLTRYYKEENITGINISDKQISACHQTAPRCKFLKMSATDLDFEDQRFDAVISVEAAFHFQTRVRFLREAYRVLRRGGRLALSDILFSRRVECFSPVLVRENHIATLKDYETLLKRVGFDSVKVRDATREAWGGFLRDVMRLLHRKRLNGDLTQAAFTAAVQNVRRQIVPAVRAYVLVGARRP